MTHTELTLGISPCPNDTYIFGGLLTGHVQADGLSFAPTLADVEELNAMARANTPDVVKISVAAGADILDDYGLLPCGGALGRGCGPLLVAGKPDEEVRRVAIPGRKTTAALLLELSGLAPGERVEVRYDRIMDSVASGEFDAGVLIHESRFTYAEHGLHLLADLGAWWEADTGLPIPLGAIAIKRSLGPDVAARVADAIRQSLTFARSGEFDLWPFIRQHAQELSDEVIKAHIAMFVTDFSFDLGPEGKGAVERLLRAAQPKLALDGSVFAAQ